MATACDWLFNYAVVQTTPAGLHYLHWGLYLVYVVLNAAFVPRIYYFIVETAGKSLEQFDKWFDMNPGWFVHETSDVSYIGKTSAKQDPEEGCSPNGESERLVHEVDGIANVEDYPVEEDEDRFV